MNWPLGWKRYRNHFAKCAAWKQCALACINGFVIKFIMQSSLVSLRDCNMTGIIFEMLFVIELNKPTSASFHQLDGNPLYSREYRQISIDHTVKYHWRQPHSCFMQVSISLDAVGKISLFWLWCCCLVCTKLYILEENKKPYQCKKKKKNNIPQSIYSQEFRKLEK